MLGFPNLESKLRKNMKHYRVSNVKCSGCANTLKKRLEPIFGDIDIDLSMKPRVLSINSEHNEKQLRYELINLGYPMIDEELKFTQTISTKAKSFVSCAIGKIN